MTPTPPDDDRCFLGIITSGYFYARDNHHRKVEWTIISRNEISEPLNKSLDSRSAVSSLNPYREEIGNLYIKFCLT